MEQGILEILNKLGDIEARLQVVERLLENHLAHSQQLVFILVGILASILSAVIIKVIFKGFSIKTFNKRSKV